MPKAKRKPQSKYAQAALSRVRAEYYEYDIVTKETDEVLFTITSNRASARNHKKRLNEFGKHYKIVQRSFAMISEKVIR